MQTLINTKSWHKYPSIRSKFIDFTGTFLIYIFGLELMDDKNDKTLSHFDIIFEEIMSIWEMVYNILWQIGFGRCYKWTSFMYIMAFSRAKKKVLQTMYEVVMEVIWVRFRYKYNWRFIIRILCKLIYYYYRLLEVESFSIKTRRWIICREIWIVATSYLHTLSKLPELPQSISSY